VSSFLSGLQTPFFLIECLKVPLGIVLFVLIPGHAIAKILKLNVDTFFEKILLSLALIHWVLFGLTFIELVSGSDWPFYLYFSLSFLYSLKILFKIKSFLYLKNTIKNLFLQSRNAFIIIGIICSSIALYVAPHILNRIPVWDSQSKTYSIFLHWDRLHAISNLNEQRNSFFPKDNPDLPGEKPHFFHWLARFFPAFFVKYLEVDQFHALQFWSPLFLIFASIAFIYYFALRLSEDPWISLFAVTALFFLNWEPHKTIFIWPTRSLHGCLFILCTMFFLKKYLDTKQNTYIVLSFLWSFMLFVKPIYMILIIPGSALFYTFSVFDFKKFILNKILLKIIIFCSFIPLIVYCIGRFNLDPVFMSGSFFSFKYLFLKKRFITLIPLIVFFSLVFILYYYQKQSSKKEWTLFELFILTTFFTGVFLNLTAKFPFPSNTKAILTNSLIIFLPVTTKVLFKNKNIFYKLWGTLLVISIIPFLYWNNIDHKKNKTTLTKDEIKMIDFIRTKTPPDSVILYNMPRYITRPAEMSALTYRKSLIVDSDRLIFLYRNILEERVYDIWNFFRCDCDSKQVHSFLSKYPNLNYLVIYDSSFSKEIHPLKGQGAVAIPKTIKSVKNYKGFEKVFKNQTISIFKINKNNYKIKVYDFNILK